MLTNTFCCFDGLTALSERRLWIKGCLEWRELLHLNQSVLSKNKLEKVRTQVHQAMMALEAGMADWFLNRLRPPDTVRILPHFINTAGYLDIETTGLTKDDHITTVTLSHNGRCQCYVYGLNLDKLLQNLSGISLLVTYNGTNFDLPRIRKAFHIDINIPHLDLRPCLEAIGYRGGLKRCEELMGIERTRDESLMGIDAVELWKQYKTAGKQESLT